MKTPLWTEGTPGAGVRYGVSDELSLTPDTLAAAISEVVESPDIPGGAIFEVSKFGGTRIVPEWNISAPEGMDDKDDGKGVKISPQMIQNMLAPILEVTEAERGKLRDDKI